MERQAAEDMMNEMEQQRKRNDDILEARRSEGFFFDFVYLL
jgi:hypothetical protein